MRDLIDRGAERRLEDYFHRIGLLLGNDQRRASFAIYAQGLFGDGERKSVEPIAARACPDPANVDAAHQRLLHFLNDAPWSDREVRRFSAGYAADVITSRESIDAWIVDDTGLLKQGKHSVGVQRQYTGTAGKVTNCQIAVSLSIASATEHVPIDAELYLPRKWTDDEDRRKEARIPADVQFRTKPELALEMIRRAVEDQVPHGVVLADAAYGNSSQFRREVRRLGLHYAVAVDSSTKVYRLGKGGHIDGEPISVGDLALRLAYRPRAYQRRTWREGTKKSLSARFCVQRVVPFHPDGAEPAKRERVWLVCEWPDDEFSPRKYYFAVVPPKMRKKQLIRLIKERWRTERVYEDLKGELGLDHFEGRRFPGWHHHVTVALSCYAFLVSERVRHFPPSARWALADGALLVETRAALPGFFHHDAPGDRASDRDLAAALPDLP